MSFDNENRKKCGNCNGNGNGIGLAVVTITYNIATNVVTNFDTFPNAPFEATECDIAVGNDLADVIACLLADGFQLVSNVAATNPLGTPGSGDALGHYTFIRR